MNEQPIVVWDWNDMTEDPRYKTRDGAVAAVLSHYKPGEFPQTVEVFGWVLTSTGAPDKIVYSEIVPVQAWLQAKTVPKPQEGVETINFCENCSWVVDRLGGLYCTEPTVVAAHNSRRQVWERWQELILCMAERRLQAGPLITHCGPRGRRFQEKPKTQENENG